MKGFFDVPAKDLFDDLTREEFINVMESIGFELEDDYSGGSEFSFTVQGTFSKKKETKNKGKAIEGFPLAS